MKLFLLIFLFCTQSFAHGFLGNPGKGVLLNERIFLLDLYSLSIHETPSVGEEILIEFANLPDIGFAYPKELLSKKLSDIEKAVPGLGGCLLESLKNYEWFLIDENLKVITDDNDPVEIPESGKIVQIANRLRSSIRINKSAWQAMDDANQAALIIHEMAFSFTTPVEKDRDKQQPSAPAKELTGRSFTTGFENSSYAKDLQQNPARYGFNIHPQFPEPSFELLFDIELNYISARGNEKTVVDQYYQKFVRSTFESKGVIASEMSQRCARAFSTLKGLTGHISLSAKSTKTERVLERFFYKVGSEQQLAIKFHPMTGSKSKKSIVVNAINQCESATKSVLLGVTN